MAPGRGPVKIAAALAIAAAGLGGGFAYQKFRAYLRDKKLRKERDERRQGQAFVPEEQQATSVARKRSVTRKRPGTRKSAKPKRKPAKSATS
jgi:hypothetical protein